MIFSIGGIVLMAYTDGFKGASVVGVVLSLGAAIGAALYKVHNLYVVHSTARGFHNVCNH